GEGSAGSAYFFFCFFCFGAPVSLLRASKIAARSTVPCFFCSRTRLTARRIRVLAAPLSCPPVRAALSARRVTGRPLRGFLAASPSFFLPPSSLLRAIRRARRMVRSSRRSRSICVDATRMRRGSIFFSFRNASSFVVIGGGDATMDGGDVEGDTLFRPEAV